MDAFERRAAEGYAPDTEYACAAARDGGAVKLDFLIKREERFIRYETA